MGVVVPQGVGECVALKVMAEAVGEVEEVPQPDREGVVEPQGESVRVTVMLGV